MRAVLIYIYILSLHGLDDADDVVPGDGGDPADGPSRAVDHRNVSRGVDGIQAAAAALTRCHEGLTESLEEQQ